jgi:hypothetical protein
MAVLSFMSKEEIQTDTNLLWTHASFSTNVVINYDNCYISR